MRTCLSTPTAMLYTLRDLSGRGRWTDNKPLDQWLILLDAVATVGTSDICRPRGCCTVYDHYLSEKTLTLALHAVEIVATVSFKKKQAISLMPNWYLSLIAKGMETPTNVVIEGMASLQSVTGKNHLSCVSQWRATPQNAVWVLYSRLSRHNDSGHQWGGTVGHPS